MKHKRIFKEPFIGTSILHGITVLHSLNGNYSVIMAIENTAMQYASNPDTYQMFHTCFGQIIKLLADNYILQKTDVIALKKYNKSFSDKKDYLSQKYFSHFQSREYRDVEIWLTITKQSKKSKFFTYSQKEMSDFINTILKVTDTLQGYGIANSILNETAIKHVLQSYLAFDFSNENFSIGNISCDKHGLEFGDQSLRVITVVDPEQMNLPNVMNTYKPADSGTENFPKDNFSFLLNIPDARTILYNQAIFIPDQLKIKKDLELKKKRHSSMPDAENQLSVTDIDEMFMDIAQNNELIVKAHYSILVYADNLKLPKACNYIDTNLFGLGIIPGRNTYNQMELFRAAIPGNADELKIWDKFTVSRPASICFFFKENLMESEKSDYLLYFTDRQGIPIGIDTSERPIQTGRMNNRNRFILGPSGSGKSFFTNSYVKQCHELGADVILVDTGHSYHGLCRYFNGKYITYREDKPITMNPFKIERVENNEEKREIIKSLIGLIWKGVDGKLSQVEDSILSKVIADYYTDYFSAGSYVKGLSFNTFYEYSCEAIQQLINATRIKFDIQEYIFILKKFYNGGIYDRILNDDFDNTLFNESFIVFEIDSIKEHKLLFPITTLIIMDVFIQKMRYKKNKKILVIEEAWKAIASPMMAGYILYLYKTVRKFAGEAIVVTQDLEDIIGNEIVKNSIISNSDTICLLDQSKFKDSFGDIAKLLSLNEVEQRKIFTINKLDNKTNRSKFKEVYIRRGSEGEVYGVEVPIEEYLTYTTERSEKEAFEVYLQEFGNYHKAMDEIMYDLKSSGLSFPNFIKKVYQSGKKFKS